MSHNVGNIAKNSNKHVVRDQIVNAIQFWVMNDPELQKCFTAATLPADTAGFERLLDERFSHNPFFKGSGLQIDCAEMDKDVYAKAIRNIPECCNVTLGDLESVVGDKTYNMIWADFCNTPTLSTIKQAANYVANLDKSGGMMFATFKVSGGRTFDTKTSQMVMKLRRWSGLKIGESLEDRIKGTITALDNYVEKTGVKNVKRFFQISYCGGSRGGSHMITVGYARGIKKNATYTVEREMIRPEQERKRKLNIRLNNQKTRNKKSEKVHGPKHGWKTILPMYAKGMDAHEIADELEMNYRGVVAVKSCCSGKFLDKRLEILNVDDRKLMLDLLAQIL